MFLMTFHARKMHFFKAKSWLKVRNFWRFSWIRWFCQLTDETLILTYKHHRLNLKVCNSIYWLQGISLRCFGMHKRCFWWLFMQGKSTFSMQKVHWKSEISDDSLEFIDFVSWRMKPLYWLINIICWLWKYVTASPVSKNNPEMVLVAWEMFLMTFHARKIHFFDAKNSLKVKNFWRFSWIRWFCKLTDEALILTYRHHMLTLKVGDIISRLHRISLSCFWMHKRCFWWRFMQGKSTFLTLKRPANFWTFPDW